MLFGQSDGQSSRGFKAVLPEAELLGLRWRCVAHPDHTGKGLGTRVLERLIEDAKDHNIETLLANISSGNEISLRFHRKLGFRERGRFTRMRRKFGKDFDVVWMQIDMSEVE